MLRNIVGGLIGGELQRRHHGNPVKGMVVGSLAMGALRRMGPVGMVLGGLWAYKQYRDRRGASDDVLVSAGGTTPGTAPRVTPPPAA